MSAIRRRASDSSKTRPIPACEADAMPSDDDALRRLQEIPNVGPAIARRLAALGFTDLRSLRGQDAGKLFDRACDLAGRREDVCLLDTFRAVVAHADGDPPRPWWELSRERLGAAAPARAD